MAIGKIVFQENSFNPSSADLITIDKRFADEGYEDTIRNRSFYFLHMIHIPEQNMAARDICYGGANARKYRPSHCRTSNRCTGGYSCNLLRNSKTFPPVCRSFIASVKSLNDSVLTVLLLPLKHVTSMFFGFKSSIFLKTRQKYL